MRPLGALRERHENVRVEPRGRLLGTRCAQLQRVPPDAPHKLVKPTAQALVGLQCTAGLKWYVAPSSSAYGL